MSWGIFHGKLAPNEFASTKCGPKHGFSGFSWEGSQESDSIRSESPWNSHNLVWKNLVASYPNGWSWVSSCSRVLARKMWGKSQELWGQNWIPGSRWKSELSSPSLSGQSMSFTVDWMFLSSSVFSSGVPNNPSASWDHGTLVCHLPCDVRVPNEASNLFSSRKYTCRADLCYTVTPLFRTHDSLSPNSWEESIVFCNFIVSWTSLFSFSKLLSFWFRLTLVFTIVAWP